MWVDYKDQVMPLGLIMKISIKPFGELVRGFF